MVASVVFLQAPDHMCSISSYLLSSFLLSAGFDSLPVPLFHEPVTEFLPCSGRLCVWWRWREWGWMAGWCKMGPEGFSLFVLLCCAWWHLYPLLCVVTLCVVTLVTVRGDTCNLADFGFFRSLCFTGLAPRSCSFFYSGRSCLMEMKGTMSMCGRVRLDGSRKIQTVFFVCCVW